MTFPIGEDVVGVHERVDRRQLLSLQPILFTTRPALTAEASPRRLEG